jgi:hypothetical protein
MANQVESREPTRDHHRLLAFPYTYQAFADRAAVLPQLRMEFVAARLSNSLTGDSNHEFQPSSLHT